MEVIVNWTCRCCERQETTEHQTRLPPGWKVVWMQYASSILTPPIHHDFRKFHVCYDCRPDDSLTFKKIWKSLLKKI